MGTTTLQGEVHSNGFSVDSSGRLSETCLCRHERHHTLSLFALVPATCAVTAAQVPPARPPLPRAFGE